MCIDGKFNTGVLEGTYVDSLVVTKAYTRSNAHGGNQVLGLAIVPVNGTVDASVEEAPVESDIPSGGGFPLQVLVIHFRAIGVVIHVTKWILCILVGNHIATQIIEVVTNVLLSCDTPTKTEFQFVECIDILQEALFVDFPCQAQGWECAPLMTVGKATGTIPTHGVGEEVAIEQTVVQTTEVAHQRVGIDMFFLTAESW